MTLLLFAQKPLQGPIKTNELALFYVRTPPTDRDTYSFLSRIFMFANFSMAIWIIEDILYGLGIHKSKAPLF